MRRALLQLSLLLGATSLLTAGTEQPADAPAVSYHMPADGQLTLGLYDQDGALLRWLVQDDFRRAGDHTEPWDGLDQWLRKVPPGSYVVRGLYHAPLDADYLMTALNPGQPPWPTSDGHGDWLSDEGNPQAVVTDGTNIFLGAPDSEKGSTTIALDATGRRLWGSNQPRHMYTRAVSLALDGKYLYALYAGPERFDPDASPYPGKDATGRAALLCYDKMTGQPARFTDFWNESIRVATWPYTEAPMWLWNLRNHRSFTPAVYAGQPRYSCLDEGEATDAVGLAAAGGKLYVSLMEENKLLELDAATAKPTGRTIPIPSPVGLCRINDHTLLAVSGTTVVRVNLTDGTTTPVVSAGLQAPDNLTIDKSGNIYVSDWGASFQVKVFDASGKFLRAIGKEGGRPWVGAWDPNGMLLPRGLAVTDAGKLWVAEDDGTPPRWSIWDAASGALEKDYLGPAPYGGGTHFWIDPHDPTELHAMGTRFKIDLARKTSTPEVIDYRRQNLDDPFTPNGRELGPNAQVRILYHDGKEYAVMNAGRLCILQRQGDIYRAVAGLGQVREEGKGPLKNDGTGVVTWDSDVGYRIYNGYFPDCFRGHAGDSFSWTDQNGDNLVQPEEMRWAPATTSAFAARNGGFGRWTANWGVDIGPDWSFFFVSHFQDRLAVFRLPVKGWTPAGAPIYDITEAQPTIFEAPGHGINSLHVTNDGKLIVSYDFEGGHSPDAVAAYTLDGKKLWAVAMPRRQSGKALHANGAIYDFDVPGLGDVVCAWLYHGSFRPHLFTTDGLYVGTFFDDTLLAKFMHNAGIPISHYVGTQLDDAPVGPDALWSESAKYFYQAPDGLLYIVNGGNQQEHLFRIRGLEVGKTGRFETGYTLTR